MCQFSVTLTILLLDGTLLPSRGWMWWSGRNPSAVTWVDVMVWTEPFCRHVGGCDGDGTLLPSCWWMRWCSGCDGRNPSAVMWVDVMVLWTEPLCRHVGGCDGDGTLLPSCGWMWWCSSYNPDQDCHVTSAVITSDQQGHNKALWSFVAPDIFLVFPRVRWIS